MSQQSIYNLLKRKNKWMHTAEMSKLLGINKATVCNSCFKLFKQKEVQRKPEMLILKNGLKRRYLYKI